VSADDGAFEALLEHLKRSRGFDFTGYKRSTLERRVAKRMEAVKVGTYADYADYLEIHPEEFAELFNTILINVTGFFRDPEAWDYVRKDVVPELLENKPPDTAIRVWSAGCASGEEPYSIAMLLVEALGEEAYLRRVKIYATDVDEDALTDARHATFPLKAAENVPRELADLALEPTDHRLTFRRDLRRTIIFGRNDLVQDAPISHIDLLVCRNALMYFNAETQGRILARLHFALEPHGFLFLGKSEMLITHSNLFTPRDLKRRVFTKVSRAADRDRFTFAAPDTDGESLDTGVWAPLREAALEASPIPQIAIDANGHLAAANRAARDLFRLATADVGRRLRDLEISYRPVELRAPIEAAMRQRQVQQRLGVEWSAGHDDMRRLDIEVTPLVGASGPLGVLVAFIDVTEQRRLQDDFERSKRELEIAYEELQSTVEELETTNEELQSTNEELETTNEELQSSNEELETMNEELQSTNEELETMNDELRQRSTELNRVNAFFDTVLRASGIGVIVLDTEARVRAWYARSEDLWGLRADEALEHELRELEFGLPVAELRGAIHAALGPDGRRADLVVEARNRRAQPIVCRVTILPLRPAESQIGGGALILVEQLGDEERALRAAEAG
jgi:two-component system, chemotaxis family, CheB/CheR fusion protein